MSGRVLGYILLFGSMFIPVLGLPLSIANPFNRSIFPILIVIMIASMAVGIVLLIANQPKLSEKRMENIDHQFPCPVCKKDVFKWGKVPSSMVRVQAGLGQPAWARICQNCGNVQHFIKTD